MSKKLSDLDQEERKLIEDSLDAHSSGLGMDSWESHGVSEKSVLEDQIGICHNCKSLAYCKTEFLNVMAKCEEFQFRLNGQNRIVECNLHSPKNVLSLTEMYSMAYLIEPKEEKVDGFISSNPKLRKKPKKGETEND